MKRTTMLLATLPLLFGGCDQGMEPGPGFMSGASLSSGLSTASGGYTVSEGEVSYDNGQVQDRNASGFFDDWMEIPQGTPITVNDGRLSGDYGHVLVPENSPAMIDGFSDGFWTEVNLMVQTPEGVSMAIFEVWGGLETLEPGTTQRYNRWEESSISSAYVSVMGCAGDVAFDWDYDGPATEVEVTVSEDPNDPERRVYAFTARFDELEDHGWGERPRASEMTGTFTGPASSPASVLSFGGW